VIVLDYKELSAEYVWATAGVVLAMSVGYWLVKQQSDRKSDRVRPRSPSGAEAGQAE
jgi:hypothetical protein